MANLESVDFEQAQAQVKCDHCDGVTDVRHYCLVCDETICLPCKTIHNKARATRDHEVVLREERQNKLMTSTFCQKHPGQSANLHCNTCSVCVCTKCVVGFHNGHNFSELSDILERLRKDILNSKLEMEKRLHKVQQMLKSGVQSWQDYQAKVRNLEKVIRRDADTLRSQVDKQERTKLADLDTVKRKDRMSWETTMRSLQEEKALIHTSLTEHDQLHSSMNASGMTKFLKKSKILRSKMLLPVIVTPPSYQPYSVDIEIDTGTVGNQSPHLTKAGSIIRAKIISPFSTKMEGFPSICYAAHNQMFLGTSESTEIHLVDRQGKLILKRNQQQENTWSLGVFKSGDLIITPSLLTLSKNILSTLMSTYPYELRCVRVTKTQELLVCVAMYDSYTSKGRVMLYDRKDRNRKYLGSDDLFEFPIQALELEDGGFCIGDCCKENLVMLKSQEEPYFPLKYDFVLIEKIPVEDRERGTTQPAKKECETNVYASARGRKMQPFEGFQRKAVVAVPNEEEFQKRVENREKEEGKEVPERAVLEMKANFTLPEEGPLFDSVEFVALGNEEATELIEKYNNEGKDNLPPPEQRSRFGANFTLPEEGPLFDSVEFVALGNEEATELIEKYNNEGKDNLLPPEQRSRLGANFTLPEEGPLFDSVEFVALGNEEATELIEKYNNEGKDNLPPSEQRSRLGGRDDRSEGGGNRWGDGVVGGRDRYMYDRSGGGGNSWGCGGSGGGNRWGGDWRWNQRGINDRRSEVRGRWSDNCRSGSHGFSTSSSGGSGSKSWVSEKSNRNGSWGLPSRWGSQQNLGSQQGNRDNKGSWSNLSFQNRRSEERGRWSDNCRSGSHGFGKSSSGVSGSKSWVSEQSNRYGFWGLPSGWRSQQNLGSQQGNWGNKRSWSNLSYQN